MSLGRGWRGLTTFQRNAILFAVVANVISSATLFWGGNWFELSISVFVIIGGLLGLWWVLNKTLRWNSVKGTVVGHIDVPVPQNPNQPVKQCRVRFEWEGKEYEGQDQRKDLHPLPIGKEVTWLFQGESPENGEIRRWWIAAYFVGLTAAGCYVLWYALTKR